jgi:hypothetical protein
VGSVSRLISGPAGATLRTAVIALATVTATTAISGERARADVPADDAEIMVAAQDLVLTLGLDRQISRIIDLVERSRKNPASDNKHSTFLEALASKLPLIRSETASIYAKRFTAEELRALTAFFRAGAGAKFLAVSTDLQKQASQITLKHTRDALAEASASR